MGRGQGERNPKERLTKKRERRNYRNELNDIKKNVIDARRESKALERSERSNSVNIMAENPLSPA